MTWELAVTEHEITSSHSGYYKDSSRVPGSKCWKAGVVTMSFTCRFQGQIHPCYHPSDFTVAIPEITCIQWIPQMHELRGIFRQMMAIVPYVYLWAFSKSGRPGRHTKSAGSIANHACSRTPCQLSSAQNESIKWSPGSSKHRGNRGCWGTGFPAGCHFCLLKGEANRLSFIVATPHHSNLSANSLVAPQVGAERRSIHSLPIPFQGAQRAAIPFCTHLLTPLMDMVTN